ncbi:putative transmembrane protein [Gregarina niphandrodes]|uniref:Transmembrane protein n=1 Tax=Gregarina niphandrodes TaxID=110365 RepID=A0A023BCD5_GRENI|nr:putative transmembrane protein [Gregarina niphandrodes]EZG83077.1 putative transmembrane protein [Gregarina niphandrodes]|eukprot:XP_011128958.1 putative transmembrane protein [Gregarina niphandrodes]
MVRMLEECNPNVPVTGEGLCDAKVEKHYINPSSSVVSQFELKDSSCSRSIFTSVILLRAITFLGMAGSAFLLMPLADKLGRKPMTNLGSLCFFFLQILSSFSPSVYFYSVCTAAVSVVLALMLIPTAVTAAELMPTGSRHYLALSQVIGFSLGGAYIAVVSYFVESWRTITLSTIVPCVWLIGGCVWITGLYVESPKWLACKGRMEEAYQIWNHIALYNKVDERDIITLEEFIRTEVESSRATVIRTPEELDEELSLMSVQYLAAPDSVVKACSSFPTSVWIATLVWVWVAATTVYSGIWHTRYHPLIEELMLNSAEAPLAPPVNQPARLLQPNLPFSLPDQLPYSTPLHSRLPYSNAAHQRLLQAMAAQQQLPAVQALPPQQQIEQPVRQELPHAAPEQRLPEEPQRIERKEPLAAPPSVPAAEGDAKNETVSETPIKPLELSNALSEVPGDQVAEAEKELLSENLPTPQEYFELLNSYLRDGGYFLLDKARMIPEKANEFYDDYELDQMLADMRRDFEPEEAPLEPDHPVVSFRKKSKLMMMFTAVTYVMDLPCSLIVILLSGRSWCGRKGATLSFSFSAGCMLVASAILSISQSTKTVLPVSMAAAGRSMLSAVFQMCFVYTAECVPTSVRCGALGLLLGFGSVFAGLIIPLSEVLDTRFKDTSILLIGGIAIAAGLLGTTTLPDTLGLPLCDTLEVQEVMYENLGYHRTFFHRRLHRVIAFVYHRTCCLDRIFRARTHSSASHNNFEARGRSWLKNKINTKSRKQLYRFQVVENDENQLASADTHY